MIPYIMIAQVKCTLLLLWILCLQVQAVFSQHTSRNNYTGDWEAPGSWSPAWPVPQTNITGGGDIAINGYITVNGSLSFNLLPSNLIINDTLVIQGDLFLGTLNNLTVNGNGILIVKGNLTISDYSIIITNNYVVITGNFKKLGSNNTGLFISNNNPAKIFIGGVISPTSLTYNNPNLPGLNCTAPTSTPYPNSGCSYGNMTDIINDPINSFFQTICTLITPTITASGPTTFCTGGSVTLTSSAGTSYLWSNGATTQSINITEAGSYTVRLTDVSGCLSAVSVATIVTVNALPVMPTITAVGPTTFCAGGSVTLKSSSATNHLWSNGATTPNIIVTIEGNYTVKVINANGCQSAPSLATAVTVNALPATPTITSDGPTTFCASGNVTLTSSAGTSYLWSTGATTPVINTTSTGSYAVQVTDASGCLSAPSIPTLITVNALPVTPTITAEGPTTFCDGGSVTLTASAGTSYLWSTGATTASINVTAAGSYTVRVTTASGCQSAASVATIVTVNALPAIPTIIPDGPITFCTGGSVNLTTSAGSTYLWSTGETTPGINVAIAGSYSVQVTNANGCMSAPSANTEVTVNALPATPIITAGGPATFCAGESVTLTSSAGTGYLWSNGEATQNINVTTAGSYSVKVTDINGCQSAPSVASAVTVNALPATPTITAGGPVTFCEGGDITLTSSTETGYLWSNGATSQNNNVTTTGSYSVKVTDTNGCQSAPSVATLVTVNALPAIPAITAGGPTTLCAGDNVTLSSSAGTSYLWSTGATTESINVTTAGSYTVQVTDANGCQSAVSTGTIVNVNALPVVDAGTNLTIPNGTSTTINATVTGTGPFTYSWTPSAQLVNASTEDPPTVNLATTTVFTLKATSTTTSCSNSDLVTITISGGPLGSIPTAIPGTVCANANVQLNAMASGGSGSYTYIWTSTPAGFTSSIANPIVNPSANTTYHVAVNDGFTTTNSQVTVTVNALPATPVIAAGGPTTFCAGGIVSLTSSAGSTYLWSNGATTPGINITSSDSYTVQVTNASGCESAASAATVVTVNALPVTPTITADGPTTFCNGGGVNLTSSAGTSYLWSNGLFTPNINVASTGSYSVKVINANGCQSAASVATVVTVNALPATPTIIAGGPTTYCVGGDVTLTSGTGSTYLWSTGATTASINITSSGSYTVRVTNANGCLSVPSLATVVAVNALPAAATITAGGPTTFCAGGSVTLTSSARTNYLWSNGATTQSINVTDAGSYAVKVTNASGCQSSASESKVITVNALPVTPTITADGPTTFCDGGSVTLTSSAGISYLWSDAATTQIINITAAGSYAVQVTNASGCRSAPSVATIITVNALPVTPTITADGPTTFCAGGSVNLTSSSGTSYLWSNAETTPGINVTTAGSYIVTVTNSNGCQSAPSAANLVTVNALPAAPTITAGGPVTFCDGGNVTLTSSSGTNYLWSNGASTQSINVSGAGRYTVKVKNSSGCQSAESAASLVVVNTLPVIPTITAGGPTTFCDGGNVILTSSAETSYSWSNGATTPSININTAGSYTVQVANASGCLSAASVPTIVTVNALPVTPTITADGPVTFCAGGSLNLTSSAGTGYLWSNGATTPSINVNTAGSYTAQVTDANGCQSASPMPITVTVNTLPLVSIASSSSSMCINDFMTLTGSPAGGTFSISDGPGTISGNILSATGTGNINLVYNYTGVCSNKATQSIIVNENPVAIAGPDQELRFVSETLMNAEMSSSETGEWSLISGSGHISDIHSPTTRVTELSIGKSIFLWKVRNGNCEASAEVKIIVYELFVPSVITPDGDGKNDHFKINEITGKVKLIIFNRWGNEEYSNGNYLNDWDGRNNKGAQLPYDTYFFILIFENGNIKKGSVLIKR